MTDSNEQQTTCDSSKLVIDNDEVLLDTPGAKQKCSALNNMHKVNLTYQRQQEHSFSLGDDFFNANPHKDERWQVFINDKSLLTRIGQRVLYITTDQDAEDLTPYLLGFEANVDLLHVESVKSKVFVKPDLVSLCMVFQKEIGQFPDLLILDSIADITIEAAASFMPEDDEE